MSVEQEETSSTSSAENTTATTTATTTETTTQAETGDKSLVTEGEKKEEASAETEYVPLTADDITIPEGFEVDTEMRDAALEVFNNRELSPKEQMQALVDLQLRAVTAASEVSSQAWTDTQEQWKNEVKADPEIGGANLQPTLARVSRLVAEYGPEGLNEVFDLTGAGNHPLMIKFLSNVASKLTEGGAVSGAPTNGQQESAASRLFPSMKGNG